jgi:hypothetical protein
MVSRAWGKWPARGRDDRPVGKLQRRFPVAASSARSRWSWLPVYTVPSVTISGEVTGALVVWAQRASPVAATGPKATTIRWFQRTRPVTASSAYSLRSCRRTPCRRLQGRALNRKVPSSGE